ncbi:MAG: cytochrome c peroxidase [Flavipsychrobacter sp.]|nr:cytochrome c peroxidase [Flavipsychrobacter sp.]
MRKYIFLSILLIAIAGCIFFSCKQKTLVPEKAIAKTLLVQVDSFILFKNKLIDGVTRNARTEELQQQFLQIRIAYKRMEWAAEYFVPVASRFVNGPPVPEIEALDNQVYEPAGLQVIEGMLYPKYDTTQKKELLRQLNLLQKRCDNYKSYFSNVDILNWQVLDAAKLEVFRIITLGITGFDDPLSQKSMAESGAALASLGDIIRYYGDEKDAADITKKIGDAVTYLNSNTDFNTFNRSVFITDYSNAISIDISKLGEQLKIPVTRYNRLLNQDAKTLFDTNAFNANAYVPDQWAFTNDKKIALGKALFSDAILSGGGGRSCQSCHRPELAFTDGLAKNVTVNGNKLLRRNTPTLLNAALQPAQFYDLRASTLEDQSLSVVQNKDEMHGNMKVAVNRLWRDNTYRKIFSETFPRANRNWIDTLEVMNAIGCYVRSLVALNSRFDEYMRGNKNAMTATEINGFNLFMGKAKCGTCHYMPLFNGTFPPRFMKIETEVIGVPQSLTNNIVDSDMGRYNILRSPSLKHAFKTTTVRNAARTAPYMHNGVFTTLEQVVDFYNKGGGNGLGMKIDNQTLPFDKLNLTTVESNELVAFIKSLDSK